MNKKSLITGIILIVIGVISALGTFNLISGEAIIYILSVGFFAAYFIFKRNLGFLIPACVLTAISALLLLEAVYPGFDELYFLMMLGGAFLAVFLIHTMHIKGAGWGERYWPIFPAVSLLVIGGLTMAIQRGMLNMDMRVINLVTPVMLVVIGVLIMASNRKKANH